MKYMLMMFGDGGAMLEERPKQWVGDMIAFMEDFNRELVESGEMVSAEGLEFPSTARTVSLVGDQVVVTDGPFAEAKEALAGFWIFDVADEARAVELASKVVVWARRVESRRVAAGPPEV